MNVALTPFTRRFGFVPTEFGREIENLMEQLWNGRCGLDQPNLFHPSANVAETETAYVVTVDLPGMKTDDIEIELKQNVLTVTGERKQVTEDNDAEYHRVESAFGKFRRMIQFDKDVDGDSVEAEYTDGVLKLSVPKSKSAQAKRIEIKK